MASHKLKTFVVDPGHAFKQNRGYGGYYESEGNLMFSLYFRDALRALGATVYLTRDRHDHDPSLTVRGQTGPAMKADAFISVHSDANGNPDRRGVHLIRSTNWPDNHDLGVEFCRVTANAMGIPLRERAVWTRPSLTRVGFDHYTVIDNSANYQKLMAARRATNRYQWDCPISWLWERGYHTNPLDTAKLRDADNNQRTAKACAAFLMGQSTPIDMGDYEMQIGTVINVTSSLRVRSSTSTANTNNVIDTISNGDFVVILETGTWHKIRWGSGVAYVHSDYIRVGSPSGGISEADRLKIRDLEQKVSQLNSQLSRANIEISAKDKSLKTIGAGIREANKH